MSDAPAVPPTPGDSGPSGAARPGLHRLLDMLVEEVSVVDRAANKHRFLIVKRESDMSKKKPGAPAAGEADDPKEPKPKKPAKPAAAPPEDTTKAGKGPKPPPKDGEGDGKTRPPAAGAKASKAFPPKKNPDAGADDEEEEEQEDEPGNAPAAEDTPPAKKPPKKPAAKDANGNPEPGEPDDEEDDDDESPIAIVLATLDSLTQAVELLTDSPDDQGQFANIADQLRASADAIASAAGVEAAEDENEEPPGEASRDGLADSIQELLTRMGSLTQALTASPRAPATAATVTTETQAPPDLAGTLDQVTQSLKSFETLVKGQAERLTVVEKRVGVPNSHAVGERVRKREPEEVSWPMDMNRPRTRESTEKSVSFHE